MSVALSAPSFSIIRSSFGCCPWDRKGAPRGFRINSSLVCNFDQTDFIETGRMLLIDVRIKLDHSRKGVRETVLGMDVLNR